MTDMEEVFVATYATQSTSNQSVEVNKVILNETKNTRRTLQSTIVKNSKDPDAALHIAIIHERKGKNSFESENPPNLSKLKGGEFRSLSLSSRETLALHEELFRQYALARQVGVERGKNQYIVFKITRSTSLSEDNEGELINLLKNCQHSPGLAEKLAKINPELIENAYQIQLLEKKRDGIKRFKRMLTKQSLEQEWQNFFKEHNWILGGVHDIQYLSDVADRPIFSGADVQGKGEKRGDFLAYTGGNARFTVIVEVKKANTQLLKSPYRPDVYCPSNDLNGGIAQLRAYLRKWQIEGSRKEENKDLLESAKIFTVQPSGILIIGNLDEIKECRKKREAFELFRQNQKDVHIITFDEVFSRAQALFGLDPESLL